MKNFKMITVALVVCLSAFFPLSANAGTTVWGPQKFVRGEGKPVTQFANFTTSPKGEFWIDITNGGSVQKPGAQPGIVEPVGRVSSAVVMLNNTTIARPDNFNQQVSLFTRDVSLNAQNTISVELTGVPGSYITLEIFRKSEENLNSGVSNATGDILASNMRDQIVLWWEPEDKASVYVIYKAYSQDGPWTELDRFNQGEPYNDVDITSDAATRDMYYKIDALDANGDVIKHYEPVRVPKYRTVEDAQ